LTSPRSCSPAPFSRRRLNYQAAILRCERGLVKEQPARGARHRSDEAEERSGCYARRRPTTSPRRCAPSLPRWQRPTPMRRGSPSERYVKCSKPGCACAERLTARHDPYYIHPHPHRGRTHAIPLRARRAGRVRPGGRSRPASSSAATSTPSGRPVNTSTATF
jgi:hypothetical protein